MNVNKKILILLIHLNWKVEGENTILGYLELVCYCANKCQTASPTICCAVAELLSGLADSQVFSFANSSYLFVYLFIFYFEVVCLTKYFCSISRLFYLLVQS